MDTVTLQTRDGARAEIHRHGAHVTSWRPADGRERLFLSSRSGFGGSAAIRGGVPVIFPQFAGEGPLPKHGFARNRPWSFVGIEAGGSAVRFRLQDSGETRAIWPHAFQAELRVALSGAQLEISLSVFNVGNQSLSFTTALHTYLRVSAISETTVHGLQGLRYRDTAAGGVERSESAAALNILGEVDRIYFDAPARLQLREPGALTEVRQSGFVDTVVWNPGPQRAAALSDLEADGWKRFLCVEAAVVGRPVQLAPGAGWSGTQTLIAR
jgi:glucose-6-phosphate 1-epimerase